MEKNEVLHIVDGKITVSVIPSHWLQCSVSGEFRPPDEFVSAQGHRRTNCTRTYNLPRDEYDLEKLRTQQTFASAEYRKIAAHRELMWSLKEYSVSVEDMIRCLQTLPAQSRLVFTNENNKLVPQFVDTSLDHAITDDNGTEYFTLATVYS